MRKGFFRVFWALFAALFGVAFVFGARVTPGEAAEKWARKLGAAGEDVRRGIERVSEAPGVAAGRQQAKMLAKTTEAITNGKWKRNTEAVSLTDWRKAAIEKGVPRIAQGATAAEPKMAAFMGELLPFIDTQVAGIANMPSTSLDDNIARMTKFVRGMAAFRRTR